MPEEDENRGRTNATIAVIISAIALIGGLITIINNIQDISEWPLPLKILAMAAPGVLLLGFEIIFRNRLRMRKPFRSLLGWGIIPRKTTLKSLVRSIRWGMAGFTLLVALIFGAGELVRCLSPAPETPTPPPVSESLYFMFVLDASAGMDAPFDGRARWDAVLDAASTILSDLHPRANYGLVLVGGLPPGTGEADPCQSPGEPLLPLVSAQGGPLPREALARENLVSALGQQQPAGGGSFGTAFSLAQFQLQDLPAGTGKWIIFITGPGDACPGEDEWQALVRKIELAEESDIHVISEMVVLDETADPAVAGMVSQVEEMNQAIADPSMHVAVAHTNAELEQIIVIIIERILVQVQEMEALAAPPSPTGTRLPAGAGLPAYTRTATGPAGGAGAVVPFVPNPPGRTTSTPALPPTLTLTGTTTLTPTASLTCTASSTSTDTPTSTATITRTPTRTRTPLPWRSPTPSRTPGGVCDCSGNLYNCSDFTRQSQAQACYDYCWSIVGYDIHNLDGPDPDPVPCENLPP